jgi:hypothetical protein
MWNQFGKKLATFWSEKNTDTYIDSINIFSLSLSMKTIYIYIYYIENNTWVRGNTRFISSVEHDISLVSAANK